MQVSRHSVLGWCRRGIRRYGLVCLGFLLLADDSTRAVAADPSGTEPFTNIGDILRLGRRPEHENRLAKVTGTITYCEPAWGLAFMQDETGGIYLFASAETLREKQLTSGQTVVVQGNVLPGRLRPVIGSANGDWMLHNIVVTGSSRLPVPARPQPAHWGDDEYDSQWIEARGVVRNVTRVDDRPTLTIEAEGRALRAVIPNYPKWSPLPQHLVGMQVSVQGVMAVIWGNDGKRSGANLLVPSVDWVTVDPEALAILFQRPIRPVKDLGPGLSNPGRVHLRGTVGVMLPGRGFFLADDTGTAWVETSQDLVLKSGDEVEVSANQARVGGRPVLKESYVLLTGRQVNTEPKLVRELPIGLAPPVHGEWIRVRGVLIDVMRGLDHGVLRLRVGPTVLTARVRLPDPLAAFPAGWTPGSVVRVDGASVDGDWPILMEGRPPGHWELLVGDLSEVFVISPPSWWTAERLELLAMALGAGTFVGAGWVLLLRRQIRSHAQTIARQRERALIAEERGRISREFHDSLEQHLVGLAIQLDAASVRLSEGPSDARRLVDIARQLARHGREEARATIWELRARALDQGGLVPALEELLPLATAGTATRIEIEAVGSTRRLPAEVEHHLLRIAQEAVTNAVKHSGASLARVRFHVGEFEFKLSISDNGSGFNPADRRTGERSGFGLVGMRERAARLHGTLNIQSRPGHGTTISVVGPVRQSDHDHSTSIST